MASCFSGSVFGPLEHPTVVFPVLNMCWVTEERRSLSKEQAKIIHKLKTSKDGGVFARCHIEPQLLRIPEVAALTNLSPRTIHRLVQRGLLKPNRATRHLLFSRSEVNRFVEGCQSYE